MKTNRDQDVSGVTKYGPIVIGGVMVAFEGPQLTRGKGYDMTCCVRQCVQVSIKVLKENPKKGYPMGHPIENIHKMFKNVKVIP